MCTVRAAALRTTNTITYGVEQQPGPRVQAAGHSIGSKPAWDGWLAPGCARARLFGSIVTGVR